MSANVENNIAFRETDQMPWHGLANPVKDGASIKAWRKAGNLEWDVIAAVVEYKIDGKRYKMEHKVLARSDDPTITFGTVGPKYIPFQPGEILEFFREYVEAGDMSIRTVGGLGQGEVIWALAEMDRDFTLPGKDKVTGNVLIMNPYQYGKAARVLFTPIVVVCQNTLQMALSGSSGAVHIPHTRTFNEEARREAKENLGIAREQMEAFEQVAGDLAKMTLADEDADEILVAIYGKQAKVAERVKALYEGDGVGAELKARDGTGWGLLNAVTEYHDWHSGRNQSTRLRSSWAGSGASKKRQALKVLLERS